MEKITFECETITPMFLAGADGEAPELRPPSIKASMRFWWRSLNGDLELAELKKKEAELFGGSNTGEGRSKFNIRTKIDLHGNIGSARPLPHSSTKTFPKPCINKRTSFIITLIRTNDELNNLFILVSILGGFGKRSRRGFGSIKIEGHEPSFTNNDIDSTLAVLNKLRPKGFKKDTSNTFIEIAYSPKPASKIPYIKKIQFGSTTSDIDKLLVKIGQSSHKNDCFATGFAESINKVNYRLASPIYVSCVMDSNSNYLPIVTTLNKAFEEDYSKWRINIPKDFNKSEYANFTATLGIVDKEILDLFYPEERGKIKLKIDGNSDDNKKRFYSIINKLLDKSIYDKRVDRTASFIGDILV